MATMKVTFHEGELKRYEVDVECKTRDSRIQKVYQGTRTSAVPPSTRVMVARTRTEAGATKRKAMALAPAILRVIIAIIVLPLLQLQPRLKTRTLRNSGEFARERAERYAW
jgi:hypothetical protein